MFIVGCAGSTAGGIKLIRVIIIFRTVFEDVFRIVHPRAVTPLRISDRVLPEGVRVAVLGLFAAWFALFVLGTLLVAIQPELDSFSSATVVAATLNVIGPGLGRLAPPRATRRVITFGRAMLTACMLLGRLEIFTALALFSPAFWRK
jgi:trk system potassium uptake protein TrkH